MSERTAATDQIRAETLTCLRSLRGEVSRILSDNDVEIIEDVQTLDAELHVVAGRCPAPADGMAASGRVTRAGFLRRSGGATQVLEPARVLTYAEMRRAG